MIVLGIIGVVVALFGVAGVMDLRARRRGVRYTVVDAPADPRRALNQAEVNMRSDNGAGGWGGGI